MRLLLLVSLSSYFVGSTVTNEGPTTNEPITRGVNEVSCNSSNTVFRCDNSSCVLPASVCNGVPDCPGGQDESVLQCGCLPNEFSCGSSCVDIVKRCDRKVDCPDGKDEAECKSFTCPPTHFKCNNFYCIPIDLVCNFEDDCGDKSDEADCKYRSCWNPEFKCDNGECIRPGFICDGRKDCKDGSDETDCSPDMFVRCGDGKLKHKYYWCDDWADCPDNQADEIHCPNKPCNTDDDYLCPNGRCIRKANVCDSQCDCAPTNGTMCADEMDCGEFYVDHFGVTVCLLGKTLSCSGPSPSKSNERCISSMYICDDVNHCYNGIDETGCHYDPASYGHVDVYECADNRTIPASLRCDFKFDCLHGDDEEGCAEEICDQRLFRCDSGQCVEPEARCNVSFECWDKSDEINCQNVICQGGLAKCKHGGQCIPSSAVCDFFIDCPDGSDEANCELQECTTDEFTCDNGQCINLTQKCYISGSTHGGCADNSHLKNCYNFNCAPNLFKCLHGPCLEKSLICNGEINCKETWDDEEGCPFSCSELAPDCECRDIHINCTNKRLTIFPVDTEKEISWFYMGGNHLGHSLTNETFKSLGRMLYLDLSNNSLRRLIPNMFSSLWDLSVLNLQNNRITEIRNNSFGGLPNVKGLHLQGNGIEILKPYAFYGLSSLPNLDLHDQNIRLIEPEAFVGLRSLVTLDLSHNELTYLKDGVFKGMTLLLFLDLRHNKIQVIDPNVFRPVNKLEKLFTDEFRFCCLAREVPLCTPPQDEFSSCEDLMSNMVLRVCVWALAIVATVGNLMVIACRARRKHHSSNQYSQRANISC